MASFWQTLKQPGDWLRFGKRSNNPAIGFVLADGSNNLAIGFVLADGSTVTAIGFVSAKRSTGPAIGFVLADGSNNLAIGFVLADGSTNPAIGLVLGVVVGWVACSRYSVSMVPRRLSMLTDYREHATRHRPLGP